MKYTKEFLEPIVKECQSVAQVMRKIGLRPCGGNQTHIGKRIRELEIDTSHFLGQGHNKGKPALNKRHWSEVLVAYNKNTREKAAPLRRALIESGRPYKCEKCNISDEWNGSPITLQVDHIDGNVLDNRPSNIRFLCPNCHSQTESWCRGSKTLQRIKTRKEEKKRIKQEREELKKQKSKSKRQADPLWRIRPKLERRKVIRPEYNVLKQEVKQHGYCKTGRKYGVSDNAIRKWMKFYEKWKNKTL